VVYSYTGCREQPLQKRLHPGFRYEGPSDPSRFSLEELSPLEIFKRTCRVLDDVEKAPLLLKSMYNALHSPEEAWVSSRLPLIEYFFCCITGIII